MSLYSWYNNKENSIHSSNTETNDTTVIETKLRVKNNHMWPTATVSKEEPQHSVYPTQQDISLNNIPLDPIYFHIK